MQPWLKPLKTMSLFEILYLVLTSSINLLITISAFFDFSKIYSLLSCVRSNHWKPCGFISHTSCPFGHKKTVFLRNLFQFSVNKLISFPSPPYP